MCIYFILSCYRGRWIQYGTTNRVRVPVQTAYRSQFLVKPTRPFTASRIIDLCSPNVLNINVRVHQISSISNWKIYCPICKYLIMCIWFITLLNLFYKRLERQTLLHYMKAIVFVILTLLPSSYLSYSLRQVFYMTFSRW